MHTLMIKHELHTTQKYDNRVVHTNIGMIVDLMQIILLEGLLCKPGVFKMSHACMHIYILQKLHTIMIIINNTIL